MIKGQTLIASDGYEVCLYPMESIRITQSHYGSYSHSSNEIKNTGLWDVTGVSGDNPLGYIYAPFTAKVVAVKTGKASGNTVILVSTNKVHLANGELAYARFGFCHDNTLDVKLGQTVKQGEFIGNAGNYGNVTGVHSHFYIGVGEWTRGNTVPTCKNKNGSVIYYMPNAVDIDNFFFIDGIRTFGKYKTADKFTYKDNGDVDHWMSTDRLYNYWKKWHGESLDLTKFKVERDESKYQVEVLKEEIRARKDHVISDDTYLGVKVPVGIYNILETYTDSKYKWVRIADGVWFALAGVVNENYIEYPANSDDYKAKYEEEVKLYNELKTQYNDLNNKYTDLQVENMELEKKIEKVKEALQ